MNDEIRSFVETLNQDLFSSVPFLPGITNAHHFAIINGETQMKTYSTCPIFLNNISLANENVKLILNKHHQQILLLSHLLLLYMIS